MATANNGLSSGQCRCCLKRGVHRKLTDTCDIHGQTKVYRELFLDCFNLDMATNTNLTDLICTGCICRLNDALDFKTQVAESEQQLLSQISNNNNAAPNKQFLGKIIPSNTVFINEMKQMSDFDDQFQGDDHFKLAKILGLSGTSVTVKRKTKGLSLNDKATMSGYVHCEMAVKVDLGEVKEEPNDNLEEDDIQPGTLLSVDLKLEEGKFHVTPSTFKEENFNILKNLIKTSPIKGCVKKDQFSCPMCDKKYNQRKNLNRHLQIHTMSWTCEICSQKFMSNFLLSRHVKTHAAKKAYACEICHKKFAFKKYLHEHFARNHGEKPFACEICGKKFSTKSCLARHAMIHTDERPYVCETCGLKLRSQCSLNKHLRVHTGDKRFHCEICDKKFHTKPQLQSHVLVHTGEKPFTCKICDKKFRRATALKNHARIHTGEKPFACKLCDAKFSDRSNLRLHFRKHTGETPISCRLCDEKFRHTAYLIAHVKQMHKGEKPFACEFCTDTFARRKDVIQHVTIMHSKKNALVPATKDT